MSFFDRSELPQGPLVGGFAGGGFTVDGAVYRSLLLTPLRADEWDAPPLAELRTDHLEAAIGIEPAPEFLLLGTGPGLTFPPRPLVRALEARGIGLDAMDRRAAARTWGLLRSEGRWIAAALMPL